MDDLLDAIRSRGWARLTWWDGNDIETVNDHYPELFDGHPLGKESQTLRPLDYADAKSGTMSFFTGLGRQPPHTDKAHLVMPPRYVVLRCDDAGTASCPTVLWALDWKKLEGAPPPLLTEPGWLIRRSLDKQFYGQVIDFDLGGTGRVRFDPLCMSLPGRSDATNEALRTLLTDASISSIEWRPGETLLIDNWRTLHARSAVGIGTTSRRLSRWISGG